MMNTDKKSNRTRMARIVRINTDKEKEIPHCVRNDSRFIIIAGRREQAALQPLALSFLFLQSTYLVIPNHFSGEESHWLNYQILKAFLKSYLIITDQCHQRSNFKIIFNHKRSVSSAFHF
jgi:hypothetical protein